VDFFNFLLYGGLVTIAISGICVLSGIILIKLGYREIHKVAMISASIFAIIFVGFYLMRSSLFPPQRYSGSYRGLYLYTLWSHTLLSLINFPLAAFTIYLAIRNRFEEHKRIAPYTAGVWIYVATTGWLIHFFLK